VSDAGIAVHVAYRARRTVIHSTPGSPGPW
jgi:hypothetical protein